MIRGTHQRRGNLGAVGTKAQEGFETRQCGARSRSDASSFLLRLDEVEQPCGHSPHPRPRDTIGRCGALTTNPTTANSWFSGRITLRGPAGTGHPPNHPTPPQKTETTKNV